MVDKIEQAENKLSGLCKYCGSELTGLVIARLEGPGTIDVCTGGAHCLHNVEVLGALDRTDLNNTWFAPPFAAKRPYIHPKKK